MSTLAIIILLACCGFLCIFISHMLYRKHPERFDVTGEMMEDTHVILACYLLGILLLPFAFIMLLNQLSAYFLNRNMNPTPSPNPINTTIQPETIPIKINPPKQEQLIEAQPFELIQLD